MLKATDIANSSTGPEQLESKSFSKAMQVEVRPTHMVFEGQDFDTFCNQRRGYFKAIFKARINDSHKVEDLIQNLFKELYEKQEKYNPKKAPYINYAGMIAKSRSIDALRRKSADPSSKAASIHGNEDNPSLDKFNLPSRQATPLEISLINEEKQERIKAVREAIGELDEKKRAVVEGVLEGLTLREVAARLNIPMGTCKSCYQRALILLSEKISAADLGMVDYKQLAA